MSKSGNLEVFFLLQIQEMVWQIVNNLDVENAKKIPLSRRSPFIEYKGHFSQEFVDQFEVSSADQFEESNEKIKGG